MKNLNHFRWLAEPCYLCLSKTAILKLWKYSCSTASPDFFTASLFQRGIILFENFEYRSLGFDLCHCPLLYAITSGFDTSLFYTGAPSH
jgi:hypothetical protein